MKILMATGGSPHSEVALRFGAQIASRLGEIPTILTVISHEADRPRADAILQRSVELLKPIIPVVHTRIRIGHRAEEIVREAEEGSYSLAVVGERQRHAPMTRFLLGSTAIRVVEHAPCPVVVAKGKIGPVGRILLCDSGVEDTPLLSRFLDQLAGLMRAEAEVTILHVMSQISAGPAVSGEQLYADAEELIQRQAPEGEWLSRDVQLLRQLNLQPHPKVRHGLVVDEILAEASEGDYDLVVIGAHRGEGWRRILLDDLAHQIITETDRPVLVVP